MTLPYTRGPTQSSNNFWNRSASGGWGGARLTVPVRVLSGTKSGSENTLRRPVSWGFVHYKWKCKPLTLLRLPIKTGKIGIRGWSNPPPGSSPLFCLNDLRSVWRISHQAWKEIVWHLPVASARHTLI
jgi:hypothetical protein